MQYLQAIFLMFQLFEKWTFYLGVYYNKGWNAGINRNKNIASPNLRKLWENIDIGK